MSGIISTDSEATNSNLRQAPDIAVIVRARRWMVSGLVISILGTRLIEGGVNGSAIVGIIPVISISILATTAARVDVHGITLPMIVHRRSKRRP